MIWLDADKPEDKPPPFEFWISTTQIKRIDAITTTIVIAVKIIISIFNSSVKLSKSYFGLQSKHFFLDISSLYVEIFSSLSKITKFQNRTKSTPVDSYDLRPATPQFEEISAT